MKLGNREFPGQAILAPLAGVGNMPFRRLCRKFGAAWACTEMLSCHGLLRNQPNTRRMLAMHPEERPVAFQLFGAVPEAMAEASLLLAEFGADIVDLNFGCPVPKVVRHRGGSALLKEPELLQAIVAACVRKCPKPITVKIRMGWDESQINAVEIAQRAQDAGAAAVAVHGRTRSQGFQGRAEWGIIASVVRALSIPVIGNGDVITGADAKAMLDQTQCAAVMVGRGALGRPWIFEHINHYLSTGVELPEPSRQERVALIREHYIGLKALKGERTGLLEMRKHTAWYLKGLPGAAEIRREVNTCESETGFLAILDRLSGETYHLEAVKKSNVA